VIQKVTAPGRPAPLTGKQRSFLRALAHPLTPVVQIGHGGLTAAVLTAIDGALATHELIKVRVTGQEEVDVAELALEVEAGTRSSIAQVIGKTLVVYRARKKDPVIVLPKTTDKPSKTAKASK
jgi:RNA-binding protein